MAAYDCLITDPTKCHCCTGYNRQCLNDPVKGSRFCIYHENCQHVGRVEMKQQVPRTTISLSFPLKQIINSFRIFQMSDFNFKPFVFGSRIPQGSYGSIRLATIKSTNQNVVLKKYSSQLTGEDIYEMLPNIREIIILRHLNQYPETKTVKLYGICIDGQTLYMVLEQLDKTLGDITIGYKQRADKNKGRLSSDQYKVIFYKLLQAFNAIHSLGFLHNDIKLANIMLLNHDIRIIDFGLSEYLGVGPLYDLVFSYLSTEEVKAPDDKYQKQFIPSNRKTYASDAYSIAASMIHMIIRGYAKIYVDPKQNRISLYDDGARDPRNENIVPYLVKVLGTAGVDLIFKLMNPDTSQRWCCRQALEHHYFQNIAQIIDDPSLQIGGDKTKIHKRLHDQYVDYLPSEWRDRKMEICYYDLVHLNYRDTLLPSMTIANQQDIPKFYYAVYTFINVWLLDLPVVCAFDSLINSLIMLKLSFNGYRPKVIQDRVVYGMTINSIYELLMKDFVDYHDYSSAINMFYTKDDWLFFIVQEFLMNLMSKTQIFIPIWCHIMYMYIELFYHYPIEEIQKLRDTFTIEVGKWVLFFFFNHMEFTEPLTSWELVKYATLRAISSTINKPIFRIPALKPDLLELSQDKIMALSVYYKQELDFLEYQDREIVKVAGYNPFKELYYQ